MPAIVAAVKSRMQAARSRHAGLDHAVRAFQRADEVLWARLAGSITYFGFLSLFPLLALAFAVLAYLTVIYADVRRAVENALVEAFPGLIGDGENQIDLDNIAQAGTSAGIIGLLALLWTGTSAVDAVRDAFRMVFGVAARNLSLPAQKLRDVGVLVVLGLLVLVSVAVSTVTTRAASLLLGMANLDASVVAEVLLRGLSLALALALDTVLLAVILRALSGRPLTWRQIRGGAFRGAIALEGLKLLATQLIGGTTTNPLYGTFAVLVAMLLWINFSARVLVLTAAWVATEPSVLAADPGMQAVHPANLPLVLSPDPPPPPAKRKPLRPPGWASPGGAAVVLALVILYLRRSRAAK